MAEKEHSQNPLAPAANGHTQSDVEASPEPQSNVVEHELRKKKRIKCIIYVLAFVVFQTGIILLFALTVIRFKNPKFRVRSGVIENLRLNTAGNSPSFSFKMNTEFGVKNTNFGHFKYEQSTVVFRYRDKVVGTVSVDKARARARSTKKFNATVVINSANIVNYSELSDDIAAGKFQLTSVSNLEGKIHLMKVIKKMKSATMKCTMDIHIQSRTINNIACM